MKIDMWYDNKFSDIAAIDCFFSDCDCVYRGNLYDANGKMIGDYSTTNSVEIERRFKFFKFS